jgi:hypothetical protein
MMTNKRFQNLVTVANQVRDHDVGPLVVRLTKAENMSDDGEQR